MPVGSRRRDELAVSCPVLGSQLNSALSCQYGVVLISTVVCWDRVTPATGALYTKDFQFPLMYDEGKKHKIFTFATLDIIFVLQINKTVTKLSE